MAGWDWEPSVVIRSAGLADGYLVTNLLSGAGCESRSAILVTVGRWYTEERTA
jgi:hypothetical protein